MYITKLLFCRIQRKGELVTEVGGDRGQGIEVYRLGGPVLVQDGDNVGVIQAGLQAHRANTQLTGGKFILQVLNQLLWAYLPKVFCFSVVLFFLSAHISHFKAHIRASYHLRPLLLPGPYNAPDRCGMAQER